jgi:hypothetical protein
MSKSEIDVKEKDSSSFEHIKFGAFEETNLLVGIAF